MLGWVDGRSGNGRLEGNLLNWEVAGPNIRVEIIMHYYARSCAEGYNNYYVGAQIGLVVEHGPWS